MHTALVDVKRAPYGGSDLLKDTVAIADPEAFAIMQKVFLYSYYLLFIPNENHSIEASTRSGAREATPRPGAHRLGELHDEGIL